MMTAHPRTCDVSEVPPYGPDNPPGYKNLPAFDQAMWELVGRLRNHTPTTRSDHP